ncbi:hypothetical protein ABZX75_11825 [Streptomyces sp. NPDC003038]|uniref:hypothetical protein n=1 Tax=unclassified Streptomyces TaxID=2593676 RepID=UPI0033AE201D
MLTETTGRTAQDLAAELEGLRRVDWASVWAGPPQGGSPGFRAWCERYGWEPQTFDRQLVVRTATGGRLTFESGGFWNPVESVSHYGWQVKAGAAEENPAVLDLAAETWPEYVAAATGVLNAPAWAGSWDTADFPEPPAPGYWPEREFRLKSRRPYRFAYWGGTGSGGAAEPFVVLSQSIAFPTWAADMPGASAISLEVRPPVEVLRALG